MIITTENKQEDIKKFIDGWIFDIDKRESEKTKDLACLLSELYYSNQFIEIEGYKAFFNSDRKRENEEQISKSILGQVIGIQSKIDGNTFSVTIANQAVRKKIGKQDKPGIRSYILTDLKGNLSKGIKIKTSDSFLSKNIKKGEVTGYTKTFIDKRRWVSILGKKYYNAKVLEKQMKKEKSLLEDYIALIEERTNGQLNKRSLLSKGFGLYGPTKETYKKETQLRLTEKIKVFYLDIEISESEETKNTMFLTEQITKLKNDKNIKKFNKEVFNKVVLRYKFVKESLALLKFNIKATEVSFAQKIELSDTKLVNIDSLENELNNIVNSFVIKSKTDKQDTNKFFITTKDKNTLSINIRMKTENVKI